MINSKMNGFHVPFLAFDQGLTPNRVVRHRRALGHRWGPAGAPDIGNDETGPWISVGKKWRGQPNEKVCDFRRGFKYIGVSNSDS
jgi:hypothetical protein